MFETLGRFVIRFRWPVIVAWLIGGALIIAFSPGLKSTQDTASFLPSKYESIKASDLQQKAFPQQTQPGAILVFTRTDGGPLTTSDSTKVAAVVKGLNGKLPSSFQGAVAQPPSPNKKVQLGYIGLAPHVTGFDTKSINDAKTLRTLVKAPLKGTDLTVGATGTAPQSLDSQDSSTKTLAIVFIGSVLLIIVLLALVFRSVLICLIPLLILGGFVGQVATGLIAMANKAFDLKADSSVQEILTVVVLGVGTDYVLFLLFRYRERLRAGDDPRQALVHAMDRAGEAIASAGGAVIVAFMALILSSLSIFRSIGPALAIGVAVTLVAALTLIPALISVFGRAIFWPSKRYLIERPSARFAAIGRNVGKRSVAFALVSGLLLAALAVFALGFTPSFDFTSSLPKNAESTIALKTLEKSLPAGETDPVTIVVNEPSGTLTKAQMTSYASKIGSTTGIDQAALARISPDGHTALVSAVLKVKPTSQAAQDDVKGPIRTAAHQLAPSGSTAYVGGTTSTFVDLDKAMARDYRVVFPVAAIIIMVILGLLLRSLVAPLYLMASVGLGFGATLGASVLLFQHIEGHSGLLFLLPVYIYLFVVALGTDYNILMIARLRDEARAGKNPHDAAAEAIRHAGPTIGSAGIILAGSFATFMFGGNSLIVSLGFSLSFGIFVAAFIMAMFFTPSLTAIIGHTAWWPGHGDQAVDTHEAAVEQS